MLKPVKMSLWAQFQRARKNNFELRPLWQIPIAAILMLIYWPANKFVDYMDNNW